MYEIHTYIQLMLDPQEAFQIFLNTHFGKTWAAGKNIRGASATPSGKKRECMHI
jgi:hypothetical protein